jgi:hypothetical protein
LSRKLSIAAIESLGQMREWATTLAYAIQHGYGVTDVWAADYREKAALSLNTASSAASTPSDQPSSRSEAAMAYMCRKRRRSLRSESARLHLHLACHRFATAKFVWEATSSYGNGRKAWEDVGISFRQ